MGGNRRRGGRGLSLQQAVLCGEKAGVYLAEWRKLVCGAMIAILTIGVLPASLLAQDFGRAMLHSDGGAWLNGKPVPGSSAIFPGDFVQTQKKSGAKIDVDGSTITIQPDTLLQFEGDELVLDHGSLQLNSARGMRVRVNCMTVIPLTQEWTRYDVIDADGKVLVVAHENDVKIHYRRVAAQQSKDRGSSDVTVHRGEQVIRSEQCGPEFKPAQPPPADNPIMNRAWVMWSGIGAVGVITCYALCRSGEPVSPDKP